MKILQIAPPALPIRGDLTYGGIERVVYVLDKEYAERDHEAYIAAPGDSRINGSLKSTIPQSIWTAFERNGRIPELDLVYGNLAHYARALDQANDGDYDIVHDHSGKLFAYRKYLGKPLLTTLHGLEEHFWNKEFYDGLFEGSSFNAISRSQASTYPHLNVLDVVYNGVDVQTFPFSSEKDDYLLFLGKISEPKGVHIAIDVARQLGQRLVIAGYIGVDPADESERRYYETKVEPYVDGDKIRFVGPVNDVQKKELYKGAKAFLMPARWKEPFGLVLIESMACGTPAIAFNAGAAPEIIVNGESGYIVDSVDEMKYATQHVGDINPGNCRKRVENNFSSSLMASRYLDLYEKIVGTPGD